MPKKVIPETPAERTSELSRMLEGREADPVIYEGNIDDRMAALLRDHQEMGARPADDSGGDTYEATYPLKKKADTTTDGRNTMPKSTTSGAKKSRKSK